MIIEGMDAELYCRLSAYRGAIMMIVKLLENNNVLEPGLISKGLKNLANKYSSDKGVDEGWLKDELDRITTSLDHDGTWMPIVIKGGKE